MSRGINKVILVGNLGADPETRYTPSNTTVTNLRIATSAAWKDRTSGEMVEKTEWHRVVLWSRLAEVAAEYLRKGSKVYIEGRLETRKWQDQDGKDRFSTEIIASEMQMLDSRGGGSGNGASSRSDDGDGWGDHMQQEGQRQQRQAQDRSSPQPQQGGFDDDIPF